MELTIYSYGYGYHMFNSLTAIAMLRNSGLYVAMINTAAMLVTAYYAVKIAASGSSAQWQGYVKKILGMILLLNALLLPQTSMNVKDNISKKIWRVDHIPLAFALPIGVLENFGNVMARKFEQAFAAIGGQSAFDYYNYGMVYGSRLAREVMEAKVRNPEFTANMKHFIERCVILPAMIGEQFTKEELVASKDMWSLVKDRAGSFTRVPMSVGGQRKSPSPTCRQAISYFENMMQRSMQHDLTEISINLQTPGIGLKSSSGHQELNKALVSQIEALYHNQHKVEDIFKHNMLLNALDNYRAAKYPAVKAQLQYESAGLISGELAEKILTGLQAVFKNLVYVSFIFMLPLMLFAGGMSKYRSWITICLSLQLWPPLLSILNMIIDIAYDPAEIVSYSSWSSEKKRLDSIASMAANLKLLIPVLAVYVTRMGEGGFLHVAGNMMSAGQGAVSSASSEAASGNISYDNKSIGNSNSYNVSENKYDDNQQFVSGANSHIDPDGGMQKILPNGQVITIAGGGATSGVGEVSYRQSDGINTSLHEGIRNEQQKIASEEARLTKAQDNCVSKSASALASIAESTRTDEGFNIDTSTDEGKELARVINEIEEKASSNNISTGLAAQIYTRGQVGIPKIAQFFAGATAEVGGEVSFSGEINKQWSGSSRSSDDENNTSRNSINERTSDHSAWLESLGVDKNQQKSISESYNEAKRLEESIAVHKSKADNYSKALEYNKTHANEFSQDLTQEVSDQYRDKFRVSDREAWLAVRNGDARAKAIFSKIVEKDVDFIVQKINAGKSDIENSQSVNELVSKHKNQFNQDPTKESKEVSDFAKEKRMKSESEVEMRLNETKGNLSDLHDQQAEEINRKYNQGPKQRKAERTKERRKKELDEDSEKMVKSSILLKD